MPHIISRGAAESQNVSLVANTQKTHPLKHTFQSVKHGRGSAIPADGKMDAAEHRAVLEVNLLNQAHTV